MAQLQPKIGDINFNVEQIKNLLTYTDSRVVIFPECFITGYPSDDLYSNSRFVTEVHESWKTLKDISKSNPGQYLIIGTPRRDGAVLRNSAIVLFEGEIIYIVDKEYLPNYDVFDDKRWFEPGKNSQRHLVIDGKSFAIGICEDVWYQEWWDKNDGADIFISINASPYSENKDELRTENIKHDKWFFFVNMVGSQDELVFDGSSKVYKNKEQVVQLKLFEEDGYEMDLNNPVIHQSKGFVDAWMKYGYEPRIVKNLAAIRLATANYIHQTGFSKTVLGVSGGADSALVAWILGTLPFPTTGISMPTRFNSDTTRRLAEQVIEATGIDGIEVPIGNLFQNMVEQTIALFEKERLVHDVLDAAQGVPANISTVPEENLQAHIRGDVLSYYSNINKALIISTGNKSEMAMGYATLYGDMRGGYNPLKDVLKTQVFEMLRLIADIDDNAGKDGSVFREIAGLPPSAELRAGQLDQDSLPPYEILDREIMKFLNGEETELASRIANAEYKRRQSAPGPRVTEKSFINKDWRMPLMNGWRK